MRVIHISGSSGSGKSTLLNRLNTSKLVVIDTDKIDDHNALELLKDPKVLRMIENCEMHKVFKLKDKLNAESMKQMISKAKENKLDVIIVGIAFNGQAGPTPFANYRFYIDTPLDVVYQRVQLRTLDEIVSNKREIEKLIKNTKYHPEIKKFIAVHKLKIRQDILPSTCLYVNDNKKFIEEHKRAKYKFMSADDIVKAINIILL